MLIASALRAVGGCGIFDIASNLVSRRNLERAAIEGNSPVTEK